MHHLEHLAENIGKIMTEAVLYIKIHLARRQSSNQFYEEQPREDKLLRGLFWEVSRVHGFK